MFFNCNWCRPCCCRREQNCNKPCHKEHDGEKVCQCHQQTKWCCIQQPNVYENKCGCKCQNNNHFNNQENEGFPNNTLQDNNYEEDFKYYYQYGSFNNLNQTENKCNCRKKEQNNTRDCENLHKPNSEQYCKPTKFICFPIDK